MRFKAKANWDNRRFSKNLEKPADGHGSPSADFLGPSFIPQFCIAAPSKMLMRGRVS